MPYVGLYIHPWHTYGQDILRGISRFCSKHPDWECYLPWPGAPEQAKLPPEPLDGLITRNGGAQDVPLDFGASLRRIVIANTDQLSTPVDISWDNHHVGRLAGEHLLEQGHRLIVFLGHLSQFPYQRQRADGLIDALAGRHVDFRNTNRDTMDRAGLVEMIRALPRPAAIFAASDPLGSEVLHAARAAGRRVPEELAVVSAGDNEIFCELSSPPLSSVALPGEEVGFLAATRLHELMTTGTRAPATVVPPRYVTVRRSSDMLAIDDELIVQAIRVIRHRATEELTVDDVRSSVPLSRRALEVRFKKAVGRTIEQEIRRVRLNRAKQLLADTDLPVADVAVRSGFTSAQRLSIVFMREEGHSPSAYRRTSRTAGRVG